MKTLPPLYRASWSFDGSLNPTMCGQGEPTESLAAAVAEAGRMAHLPGRCAKSATVLRDSRGTDHPDNAGKFFLHQIIK